MLNENKVSGIEHFFEEIKNIQHHRLCEWKIKYRHLNKIFSHKAYAKSKNKLKIKVSF